MPSSTNFQTVEQTEVVKEVVLPKVSKLNDPVVHKNDRYQTQFFPEKNIYGFSIICIFAICYPTEITFKGAHNLNCKVS